MLDYCGRGDRGNCTEFEKCDKVMIILILLLWTCMDDRLM